MQLKELPARSRTQGCPLDRGKMAKKQKIKIKIVVTTLGSDNYLEFSNLVCAVPVDGVDGQDGVAAHVAVPVLQAGADGRHQRLQQLRLLQLAQKAQRGAADELVWVLQILKATGNAFES